MCNAGNTASDNGAGGTDAGATDEDFTTSVGRNQETIERTQKMTRRQDTEPECDPLHESKLALPTKGARGMKDVVADVFGRAKTFTIIVVKEKNVTNVEIIQNTAASYKHGAGPLIVKTLIDLGVTTVVASELGPGVSTLLEQFNVARIKVKSDTPVDEAIKVFLE